MGRLSTAARRITIAAAPVMLVVGLAAAATPQATPLTTAATAAVTVPGLHAHIFATGTGLRTQPDDITRLGPNLFVAYQNGVHALGQASAAGRTFSTVIEYGATGRQRGHWRLTGHVDGLRGDAARGQVLATANEDGNSSFYIIGPFLPTGHQVAHLSYAVNPATAPSSRPLASGGGTDSIATRGNELVISASNPTPNAAGQYTHAAAFLATLTDHHVTLAPAFLGNAPAVDATTGSSVVLNVSDPDSSTFVPSNPAVGGRFAGQFALNSQGDGTLIFAKHLGQPDQLLTRLVLGTQINDVAWATAAHGTLYVTDTAGNAIQAITGTFTPGDVFVACPADSGVGGFVGLLNTTTGTITPVAINLQSPAGLLFMPATR